MVVHLTETFPKDLNNNHLSLGISSNAIGKKFYHFAESPPTIIIPPETQSKPSRGVASVLLGPPSDETVINYKVNCRDDTEEIPESKLVSTGNHQSSPCTPSNLSHNPTQNGHLIGRTVSVSTCNRCGTESSPTTGDRNVRSSKYSVQANELIGKDGSSSRSTPVKEFYLNSSSTSKRSMNSSSGSSSPKMGKNLRLKGCHICHSYKPSPSLSLTPPRRKIKDECPYSIVLGSFHPGINRHHSNYRTRIGINQSNGSKEETRRALIMIFTITSILLFLMITYYGAIIYLRMRVSSRNYDD